MNTGYHDVDPSEYDILIVDDNSENLKVLGSFLVAQGFNVRAARDGQQALESIEMAPPDIVLLDIHMPVLDGYGACKVLKADKRFQNIPIIFLSALGETFNKVRAFEVGGSDYIVKPFELEEVRMRVGVHLLANRQLAESRAGFRASFEQAAVGMAHVRLDGEIVAANHHLCELLGHEGASLTRSSCKDVFQEEFGDAVSNELDRLRDGEVESPPTKMCLGVKGGEDTWCKVTFSHVRVSVRSEPYLVLIVDDVTQQLRLEAQLRQSQKMEAIGTLAAGIAHDFNNLLTAISGYTELALMDLDPEEEMYENLSEVAGAAVRARELVKQILAFGRQTEYHVKPICMQEEIREVVGLLRRTVEPVIELQVEIDEACPSVLADTTAIHQILMNLCTNAYHAMEENGGVMGINLSHRMLDAEYIESEFALGQIEVAPGDYARIDVCDTGYGMDEATRLRIFDPYFTTKEPGRGTGLGLATVHGIVKDLKGFIFVYSEKNLGSTFSVFLPITTDVTAPAEAPAGYTEGHGSEHILFVDDEESICRFAEKSLTRLGYTLSYFVDPEVAMKAFCEDPDRFDVVITDEIMPKMRGTELLGVIRDHSAEKPVILYSGFSESQRKPREEGDHEFNAHVLKPMVTKELASVIRRVLNASNASQR